MSRRVTLYVAPLGNRWSVLENGSYYGEHKLKSDAAKAAEARAVELRSEGYTVAIASTDKKPGGRR